MIRSILILLGVALVVAPVIISVLAMRVDGITTLSLLGLVVAIVANRWHPTTQ